MKATNRGIAFHRYAAIGILIMAALSALFLIRIPRVQNPFKVPIVGRTRLLDISNYVSRGTFTNPVAVQYCLLLGLPSELPGTNRFIGAVSIVESGITVLTFALEPQNATAVNWLDKYGIDGYLIKSESVSNGWNLNASLRGKGILNIVASNGPIGGSIWLYHVHPSGWDFPFRRTRSGK